MDFILVVFKMFKNIGKLEIYILEYLEHDSFNEAYTNLDRSPTKKCSKVSYGKYVLCKYGLIELRHFNCTSSQ